MAAYQISGFETNYDSAALLANPSFQLSKQAETINEKNIELQKNKAETVTNRGAFFTLVEIA